MNLLDQCECKANMSAEQVLMNHLAFEERRFLPTTGTDYQKQTSFIGTACLQGHRDGKYLKSNRSLATVCKYCWCLIHGVKVERFEDILRQVKDGKSEFHDPRIGKKFTSDDRQFMETMFEKYKWDFGEMLPGCDRFALPPVDFVELHKLYKSLSMA